MTSQCPGMILSYTIVSGRCLTCPDLSAPNSYWSFCPSIGPAYLFTVLFGITMIAHFIQAILYKKPYCWVIVVSALLQTAAYIGRILSIRSPGDFGEYATWFVLILVSSAFLNISDCLYAYCSESIDCPTIHECIYVYGHGKDDLELCGRCKDILSHGMEIRFPFRCSWSWVCLYGIPSK